MDFGGTFDWILAAICIGVAILLLSGNGTFLIVGTKGQNKKEVEKKYDVKKLSMTTGVMAGVLGIMELVIAILGKKFDFLMYAYIPVVIIVFVAGIIVINKKCRK